MEKFQEFKQNILLDETEALKNFIKDILGALDSPLVSLDDLFRNSFGPMRYYFSYPFDDDDPLEL